MDALGSWLLSPVVQVSVSLLTLFGAAASFLQLLHERGARIAVATAAICLVLIPTIAFLISIGAIFLVIFVGVLVGSYFWRSRGFVGGTLIFLVLIGATITSVGFERGRTATGPAASTPTSNQPAPDQEAILSRDAWECPNPDTHDLTHCFGLHAKGTRVRLIRRESSSWFVLDHETNGPAYVDSDAVVPQN
jgi:energy-coupling factor transporter transmembrane protein EcfT